MRDRTPKSKVARRQQKRRGRARLGIKSLSLPVRNHRLVEALVLMTRLSGKRSTNKRSIRAAAAKLLDDVASEWLAKRR
jgi:hypothetical protein